MNRPKAHHKVPRFYLEGFRTDRSGTGKKARVWVYRRGEATPRLSNPRRTGFENNFYSLIDDDGDWNPSLEKLIERYVDTPASRIWTNLANANYELTAEERTQVSFFIALLFTRTSNIRQVMGDLFTCLETMTTQMMNVIEERSGDPDWKGIPDTPGDPDSIIEIESLDDLRLEHNDFVMMTITGVEDISSVIYRMNWTFFHSDEESVFITSDNPISRVNPFLKREWLSADIGREGVEVSIPLTKKCCLVCSYHGPPAHILVDAQTVNLINSRTYSWSIDEVYSSRRMGWLTAAMLEPHTGSDDQ